MLASRVSFAQDEPHFSQYMYNRLFYNPAYAGSENGFQATGAYRTKWVEAGLISVDAPVKALKGGLGVSGWFDRLGTEKVFGFKAAYAYKILIGKGSLNLGIDGGLTYWQSNYVIPNKSQEFNISMGAYYQRNGFYAGASATHLIQEKSSPLDNYNQVPTHHYYMAGYNIDISDNFSVEPSLFLTTDWAWAEVNLNITVHAWTNYWIGTSYRYQDAVVVMGGLKFKRIQLGYSYDITNSVVRSYSSGVHEITLGYIIPEKKVAE